MDLRVEGLATGRNGPMGRRFGHGRRFGFGRRIIGIRVERLRNEKNLTSYVRE